LSSSSTARLIHHETQRIITHFTTVNPTSDDAQGALVGPLIGTTKRIAAIEDGRWHADVARLVAGADPSETSAGHIPAAPSSLTRPRRVAPSR
jgi:hypothetical protein